nr:KNOX class 2 transcription factor [Isoetes lacustris]
MAGSCSSGGSMEQQQQQHQNQNQQESLMRQMLQQKREGGQIQDLLQCEQRHEEQQQQQQQHHHQEHHRQEKMPTWLTRSTQQQLQDQEGRKWCSCGPGDQCIHCAGLHHTESSPAVPGSGGNNNNNNYTHWLQGHRGSVESNTAELLVELPHNSALGLSMQHSIDLEAGVGTGVGPKASDLIDPSDPADLDDCHRLQNAGLKAEIVSHPLYEQLLEAHVSCLRIATPVDQLPKINGQLANCNHVIAKYSFLANHQILVGNNKDELDQFMAHYVMLLRSFKEQLQHHVRVHAKEAVMACWELEQNLLSLTGVTPGEGSGATMSDDEEDQAENDYWQDNMGFGPLIPTETERTLMERVRQELKLELKQGYRARIVDVREEILRKRRAGKLPGDTTSVLKAWWHAHAKWPYPTEDEKARLVQETGLELKQINNWFINQRKRNWHHHPSSSTSSSKIKCKR